MHPVKYITYTQLVCYFIQTRADLDNDLMDIVYSFVSRASWSRYSNGKSTISFDKFIVLAAAVRVAVNDIMREVNGAIYYLHTQGVGVASEPAGFGSQINREGAVVLLNEYIAKNG